jgi:hypothetical protein
MNRFTTLGSMALAAALALGLALRADQIHEAAKRGDLAKVRSLVDRDPSLVAAKDKGGETPLHWAAFSGNVDLVRFLLDKGAEIDATSGRGLTPLAYTAVQGRIQAAGLLIERGADVNVRTPLDMTPLIIAAEQGAVELVKRLVLAGADVGVESRIGTALHRAAIRGQTEIIQVLLKAGAKTEVMSRRFSPLHLAAMAGQEKKIFGNVEISAAEVDDSAFSLDYLIKTNGSTIFYAGFYPEDIEAFKKEIDFPAGGGERCDIAFVHTTDGDDHPYAAYIMEKLRPKAVLPMDPNHRVMDYRKMAGWLKEKYPGIQTGCVENPGDAHIYDQGKSSLDRAFYFSPRMGALLRESQSRKAG